MSKQHTMTNEERVNEAIARFVDATYRGQTLNLEEFLLEYADVRTELDSFYQNQCCLQQMIGTPVSAATDGPQGFASEHDQSTSDFPHNHVNDHDTQLIALLDEAIDDIHSGAGVSPDEWAVRHPEVGIRGQGLLKTVRDLALAADDWRAAAQTILGSEIAIPNRRLARTAIEDTWKISQGNSDPDCSRKRVPPPLPNRFGRYEVKAWIGSGAMGDVFQAWDPQLKREVALKVPKVELRADRRDEFNERFLREARTGAAVRHQHVCPIYDSGEQDGTPYVVMAFIKGESLAERLKRQGRFEDVREAVSLVLNIAEALDEVHRNSIIHRDLKPGNILVDETGKALLTDFGLARSFVGDDHLTAVGVLVGTLAYMAPEQALDGGNIGPASDIYGLGIVLYETLTGRLPFTGGVISVVVHKAQNATVVSPANFRADLDSRLIAIVERAMEYAPDNRFPDARAFANALRGWLNGDTTQPTESQSTESQSTESNIVPETPPISPVLNRYSRRWVFGACAIPLMIVAVGFTMFGRDRESAISNPGPGQKPLDNAVPIAFASRPSEPPITGELKIRFISDSKQGWEKAHARIPKPGEATPLFNGDGVQLQMTLSRPGYVYLIWIDSDGSAQPIYPWDFGGSDKLWRAPLLRASHEPATVIRCPEAGVGFVANALPGIQHVVFLARSTPLDSLKDLEAAFSKLPPSPLGDAPVKAEYLSWAPGNRTSRGLLRGLQPKQLKAVDESEPAFDSDESDFPLFELMKSRLTQHHLEFDLIKVWRFAQKEDS